MLRTICHLLIFMLSSLRLIAQADYNQAVELFNAGRFEESIQLLKTLSSDTTIRGEVSYLNGLNELELKNYSSAILALKTAIQDFERQGIPDTFSCFSGIEKLGEAFYLTGNYSQAEKTFGKALKLLEIHQGFPLENKQLLLSNLAATAKKQHQYIKADSIYSHLLTLYPEPSVSKAKILSEKGLAEYKSGDKNGSLQTLNQVIDMLDRLPSTPKQEIANIQYLLAALFPEDSEILKNAINVLEKEQDERAYELYLKLAMAETNRENYDKAIRLLQHSLEQPYSALNQNTLLETKFLLAKNLRITGRFEAAEKYYLDCKVHAEEATNPETFLNSILNDLGLLYQETGRYDQALHLYREALDRTASVSGTNSPEYAITQSNLALLYRDKGQYDKTETGLTKATSIFKNHFGEHSPEYAAALNNQADFYRTINKTDEAEKLYIKTQTIYKQDNQSTSLAYALLLNNLGAVTEEAGRLREAEIYYHQSLNLLKILVGEQHAVYATTLNNLALVEQKKGDFSHAEERYHKDIETVKSTLGTHHPAYASALSNLAGLYENTGQYKPAEKLYEEALKVKLETLGDNHPDIANTRTNLARVKTVLGKTTEAKELWSKALKNYQNQINLFFPFMSEKEKTAFYKHIRTKFDQFHAFALQNIRDTELVTTLWNNLLENKAILFQNTNKLRQVIYSGKDEQLKQLFSQWQDTKEKLARYYSLTEIGLNVDSLNQIINGLEKQLSLRSSEFLKEQDSHAVSIRDIRNTLKENEALIEIVRIPGFKPDSGGVYTGKSFYLFLLLKKSSQTPEAILIKNGKEMEGRFLHYYKNTTRLQVEDEYSYGVYWEKLAASLQGISRLFMTPDGVYNQINPEILRDMSTGKYVADDKEIIYLSYAKELLDKNQSGNQEKSMALFGNPFFPDKQLPALPGTSEEVNGIAKAGKANGWDILLFENTKANKENLKKLRDVTVLHIASHGYFHADENFEEPDQTESGFQNPLLNSGIYLSNNDSDKGELSAFEAMNLYLDKTELVVLSACETGMGIVKNGEGVYGLQRAFKVAGARHVIMSLWKVDDQTTKKLMIGFYENWLTTKDLRNSFREAKKKLRTEFPDPYNWGAFILTGN